MKKIFNYLKHNLKHKWDFWRWSKLKEKFKKYGLPLLIIFIVWEIIEDIIFPYIAYLLGKHVHQGFYTLIPVSWLACAHPIAVPAIFWIYLKISGKKKPKDEQKD